MGRFSKLEPTQPGEPSDDKPIPTLDTRLTPGEPGATGDSLKFTAIEFVEMADQAWLRADYKNALRYYSRALDKDSTLANAWVDMIRVLLLRGDLSQADTWTNRALTLFPNHGSLLAMRAVVKARRGIMREALNNSDALLAQHPADPVTQIARGEILLLAENKNYDFCFSQALTMVNTHDWKTPAVIAMILEEQRLWAKAIQYYTKAYERNETSAALLFRVARCRAELGHAQQARKALAQARELCPADDPLIVEIDRASTGSVWNRLKNLFR